jgi:DNA mismatch repair protein MutS
VGAVEDDAGHLHFLHQIQKGPADKSYGIHVAALAGLPDEVITNATKILTALENKETVMTTQDQTAAKLQPERSGLSEQVALFNVDVVDKETKLILDALDGFDILKMTPVDAMNALNALKQLRN